MMTDGILIVLAYLLGSLSGAIVICQMMALPDPRTQGSKNPGATNVLRYHGKKMALLTLIIDILKGAIAVLISRLLSDSPMIWGGAALAAFLGHLYPIFFRFRGGKGVATAFGVLVALTWQVGLLALFTWLGMAILFRYSSLSALTTAVLTPIYMYGITQDGYNTVLAVILSTLLIWRHRSNIHHLLTGQEHKIGYHS